MKKKPTIIIGHGQTHSYLKIAALGAVVCTTVKSTSNKVKIHLADVGQDLLWFIVDITSDRITEAGPFQNQIYAGKFVFCPRALRTGMYVEYSDTPIKVIHQPLTRIKYPITKIERL